MSDQLVLLDLEEKLLADQDGELRAALLKWLQTMELRLAAQRRQLNSRQRYLEIQSSLQAVSAAQRILGNIYVGPPAMNGGTN